MKSLHFLILILGHLIITTGSFIALGIYFGWSIYTIGNMTMFYLAICLFIMTKDEKEKEE